MGVSFFACLSPSIVSNVRCNTNPVFLMRVFMNSYFEWTFSNIQLIFIDRDISKVTGVTAFLYI